MHFALVQSLHLVSFSRELTRISIGGAIRQWLGRMGLVTRRSLYAVCTGLRATFLTSQHPQFLVNMQFALVQALHLVGFSRELTRISIGGSIRRWLGSMGLLSHRSLNAVCTNLRTTFSTSPHPQLSVNMQFALVQALHLVCFKPELTRISIGGAISRWKGRTGFVARRSLYNLWETWRMSITIVPCLHQSNVYIKR